MAGSTLQRSFGGEQFKIPPQHLIICMLDQPLALMRTNNYP